MSDEKISAMPNAGALTGAELVPVVQGGANVKATAQNIANLAPAAPAGANPTATAGPNAVNGSAGTFLRSDGAPAIQKGSNAQFGIVEGDGVTISIAGGVVSSLVTAPAGANPTATAGPAAVNGSAATFMRSDGAPAIQLGTNAVFGLAEGDGITINLVGGVASVITNPLVVTGINFGVTTLANYQEANWTPSDQSGAGLSFTNNKTVFTRVGRLVVCTFSFTFPATADASPVTIGGLPLSGPPANEYVIGTFSALSKSLFGFTYVAPSTTQLLFLNAAAVSYTNVNFSGSQIVGQFIITK